MRDGKEGSEYCEVYPEILSFFIRRFLREFMALLRNVSFKTSGSVNFTVRCMVAKVVQNSIFVLVEFLVSLSSVFEDVFCVLSPRR